MDLQVAIVRELYAARTEHRRVVHARVTEDAIPGTVAALPVTPERARTLGRLWMLPTGVVADPTGYTLELLIHPDDFAALAATRDPQLYGELGEHVLGVPLSYDPKDWPSP